MGGGPRNINPNRNCSSRLLGVDIESNPLVGGYKQLEALWSSSSELNLIRFYGHIRNVQDLVAFSERRPRAAIKVVERKPKDRSRSETVVVVPTADSLGLYSKKIERYFERFRILFVESSGQFFNYATSVNHGVKFAIESNPEWILVSNDDMIPSDPISAFIRELELNRHADALMVSSPPGTGRLYHSYDLDVLPVHTRFEVLMSFLSSISHRESPPLSFVIPKILARFGVQNRIRAAYTPRLDSPFSGRSWGSILRKLGAVVREAPYRTYQPLFSFRNFGDFGVFKADVLSKYKFDEVYINGEEDVDISYSLWRANKDIRMTSFKIGSIGEATISPDEKALGLRWLRSILNKVYFCYKNGLLDVH